MNFSSANNITLSDSLSGYVTCDDEDADNTQYLSVLNQDVSFEEMSVTLCNSEADSDETHFVEITSEEEISQPFIFTIDGSNEIYGVQTARDEDGNLQKYQIQYTRNINGELLPMLETIQLLPSEEDVHAEIAINDNTNDEVQQAVENQLFSDTEANNSDFQGNDKFRTNEDEFNQKEGTTNKYVCKSETLSGSSTSYSRSCIKHECVDLFDENSRHQTTSENSASYTSEEMEIPSVQNMNIDTSITNTLEQIEENGSNTESAEHFVMDNSINNEEQDQALGPVEEHFEQLFVQENHITEDSQIVDSEDIRDNDSDNETYHIVDGVHVTGDVESENSSEQPMESVLEETIEHYPKTNILKKSTTKCVSKEHNSSDHKIIYVQTLPEKENMEILEIGRLDKPNSRSLLKCNQLSKSLMAVPDPLHIELKVGEGTYSHTKRYFRTKEAKQARQFLNFINSTTIPQVPERKERLPRKQQIKPLKHLNEDIIVKEMIVSSNSFIEPISVEEKKYLPVTEYVEVLDSGDECSRDGDERKKKKSKRQLEPIEIEISDSDESDIGIFESDNQLNGSDEEKSDMVTKNKLTKKKRGRPPKNKNLDNDKKDSDSNSESPPKISRTESDVESVTSSLEVIRVENEAIVSSSNMNRSTKELNIISTESYNIIKPPAGNEEQPIQKNANCELSTLKDTNNRHENNKTMPKLEVHQKKGFEYKHECEKCKTKFINKFLLNRHDCIVKSGLPFSCDNCEKKFPNIISLNVHKKVHAKGASAIKSNSSSRIPQFTRTFSKEHGTISSKMSVTSLKNPTEMSARHPTKESVCPVRNPIRSCGSTLKYPPRPSCFLKPKDPVVGTPDKTSNTNIFKLDKHCDKCSKRFHNNAAWFDHQVLEHGLKTPDKNIGDEKPKKLVKPVVAHNGLRAGPAVAKNFTVLRSKIQQLQ